MPNVSQKAHVAANVRPIPNNLSFCTIHGSDFWVSGTILTKTNTSPPSTCKPGQKTFTLYMTATEISTGLKKDDRIVIQYDNAQSGDEKLISSYSIQPALFSVSLRVPALEVSTSMRTVDDPCFEGASIWSRLLSRFQFESRVVLFKSLSWRWNSSHVSLEEVAVKNGEVAELEDVKPPRESGFPTFASHRSNGDRAREGG